MRILAMVGALGVVGLVSVSAAQAACTGTNGRGWGSGNGAGQFTMTQADKNCRISFPGFVDDRKKTRIPATEVSISSKPKSGKLTVVAGQGLIYTPNAGFRGRDRFCTINTSPKVKGGKLSGCVSITVR
jgi:hypothetical protein